MGGHPDVRAAPSPCGTTESAGPVGRTPPAVLGPGWQACPHPTQVSQSGEWAGESTLKGPQGPPGAASSALRLPRGRGRGGVDRSNGSHPSTFPEAWRRQARLARPIHPSFPFYLSANCTQGILRLTRLTETSMWKGGRGGRHTDTLTLFLPGSVYKRYPRGRAIIRRPTSSVELPRKDTVCSSQEVRGRVHQHMIPRAVIPAASRHAREGRQTRTRGENLLRMTA